MSDAYDKTLIHFFFQFRVSKAQTEADGKNSYTTLRNLQGIFNEIFANISQQ